MRVNLSVETPSQDCGCLSLLEHWESAIHRKALRCSVAGCLMPPGDAVVVTMAEGVGAHAYVVPVCRGHAIQRGGALELRTGTQLVNYLLLPTCTHRFNERIAT